MLNSKSLIAVAFVALLATTAQGYGQTEPDPHHPQTDTAAAPATPDSPQPDMMGMMSGMMKMMGGMMNMMGGGPGPMGMAGMDMSAMGMTERVEGRIAFLRAELRITEAQSKAWDEFAATLRDNAKRMKDAGVHMTMPSASASQIVTRLEAQERSLTARLEGVRAMKSKLVPLYQALSEEQRKTADELLGPHIGVGMRGMMMKSQSQ